MRTAQRRIEHLCTENHYYPCLESSGFPPACDSCHVVPASPRTLARDEFERIYFEYHLVRENHSMTRVSERTGLERTHLYRKLKQLGIESARKRGT